MFRRRLAAALTAAVSLAVPAVAEAAQDGYSSATNVNAVGSQLAAYTSFGNNGLEANIGFTSGEVLPGGFAEPDTCGTSGFGATAWYELHPDVPGIVRVTVRGDESGTPNPFDGVLVFYPFNRLTGVPNVSANKCIDAQRDTSPEQLSFAVGRGQSYKVQVGGWDPGDGSGPYQNYYWIEFEFFRDTDGDGEFDATDKCKTTPGDRADGCKSPPPRPDRDGDGVFDDGPDKCLGQNSRARDENANGCLDYDKFTPVWDFDPGAWYTRRGGHTKVLGIVVQAFGLTELPPQAKVSVSCTRHACKSSTKRASRVGVVYFKKYGGKKWRAGAKVLVRVTKSGYIGRWRQYRIKKASAPVAGQGCLLPGSSKLRKPGKCPTQR